MIDNVLNTLALLPSVTLTFNIAGPKSCLTDTGSDCDLILRSTRHRKTVHSIPTCHLKPFCVSCLQGGAPPG